MILRRYVDGHWIDVASLFSGFAYAADAYAHGTANIVSTATGLNIGKGSALFPLLVLSMAVLSSWLRNELIKANPLTLSLPGCVALLATLAD